MEIQGPERRVAIVGRPNVGKSALFNRLAGRRIAIVHDQPGVTRDRLAAECRLGTAPFTLIDTGGIGVVADQDFAAQVRQEADLAIAAADLILFVTDGREGLTPVDRELARQLRRSGRPTLLAVNKVDESMHEDLPAEFNALGFDDPVGVSAAHGRHIGELVDRIEALLPSVPSVDMEVRSAITPPGIAIVGRPNVGKSSLVNALLGDSRTIVSSVAGTTRDAVDIPFQIGPDPFLLIDTAGIRARGRRNTSVEVFSVMRSEESIRRADVCVLVIDASEGVTTQDKKIAGLIQEARKPCILVLNKWDLVKGTGSREAALTEAFDRLRAELFFLDYAPAVALSAKTGEQLRRLTGALRTVRDAARTHLPTGPLNRAIQAAQQVHPPPMSGSRRLKILYATHTPGRGTTPAIDVVLFVNDPKLLPDTWRKFLENIIRKEWPCIGVPIRFLPRGRPPRERGKGRPLADQNDGQ